MSSPFLTLSPKKMAIVCAGGVGDSLILSIAAYHLQKIGIEITVFSPHLFEFGKYLKKGTYLPYPLDWEDALFSFDAVFLQHEDTKKSKFIKTLRSKGLSLFILYTNYHPSKHGDLLTGYEYPVNPMKPMVENMQDCLKNLFHIEASKENSLFLFEKSFANRQILIHPESKDPAKNWSQKKFLRLFRKIDRLKVQVKFILSAKEKENWPKWISVAETQTLEQLASLILASDFLIGNDSGPAHLASYFSIPHIVICQGRQMPLWSTGWYPPHIITPPKWIPNLKGSRLREKHWQKWISVSSVFKQFEKLYPI